MVLWGGRILFNTVGKRSVSRTKQPVVTIHDHYYGATSQNTTQIAQNVRKRGLTFVKK